ncbi:Glycosyltransferase, catalytic subunit of cellulose synthase and poly-beta-1,6-N-acetylglucosamine synthase [Halopenitus malekzadehii]|uniref:Glycosyltransferase, catalytic subunit of cellulose synthase and poly-beta-1,6-N-acetylglucosamine synthase n=1 Tax=Halopenitus malekzadehii TaxID=1267564 RepID=A0A1H6I9Z4_9EURY|nr:glycosyltransferase family 2 protein [Halopenitus malekzadehii]SEH43117.1 Glycosyltransferase, catalytic subunit of cellulose synthase and poly-beta-1,6-N-acetylglucosamine synthase [Halopenitus malekzadehii]
MLEPSVAALLNVFVATQIIYGLVNLSVALLLYTQPVNRVDEALAIPFGGDDADVPVWGSDVGGSATADAGTTRADRFRPIHVLLAIRSERRAVIEETIADVFAQEYPTDAIHVYVVYEADDDVVGGYVEDLAAAAAERGWDVVPHVVDREGLSYYLQANARLIAGDFVPRTKAAALTYAFASLSFEPDDVVTVSDADTTLPADTFRLAVGGLEEYDIVQAKQTVRNVADGWLPTLEAMGIVAWSDAIYTRTSTGPYQLLGKGYFIGVADLYALDAWDPDAITEDMTLGVAAYLCGYRLGVIDRYVQDLCPPDFRDWVRQKRRWVGGPYGHLFRTEFTLRERVRFWTFTVANQAISVANFLGIPVGAVVAWSVLVGPGITLPTPVTVLVAFNLLCWIEFTRRTYAATRRAVRLETRRQKARFYLISNPITQAIYAALWAVPIASAVWGTLRGATPDFEVTPK